MAIVESRKADTIHILIMEERGNSVYPINFAQSLFTKNQSNSSAGKIMRIKLSKTFSCNVQFCNTKQI